MYIKNKYSKILIVTIILCQLIFASYDMRIHKTDNSVYRIEVSDIVNIIFQDGTIVIKRTSTSDYVCATTEIDRITFQETGTITDIDGNSYKTVKIGNQWWMAENLKVTRYRNGESIDDCWAYNDDESNVSTYGRLYSWNAFSYNPNIGPEGWHVPTDDEWEDLAEYISNQIGSYSKSGDDWYYVGTHLKSTTGWNVGNGTDDYGFAGLPAGCRNTSDSYSGVDEIANFWSATQDGETNGRCRSLMYNDVFYRNSNSKDRGFSVRCVRD
jgi:uncharacterized protein (TIGR02145 family)